jgi:hypothetical protein
VRLGLVVEGEDGRPGLALDDLSTTTHPLLYRSSELDRQGVLGQFLLWLFLHPF